MGGSYVMKPFSRRWWSTPIFPAVLIAIYTIFFGYTRDFGLFLLTFILVPVLFLTAVVSMTYAVFVSKVPGGHRKCYLAAAIILVSPLLGYFTIQVRDQARFLVWSPFHLRLLNQDSDKDGIVTLWDDWGALGWFNESYLVRTSDQLTSLDKAEAWRKRLGWSCEIVKIERVWPKLYVVTTRDCVLEVQGIEP